MEFLAYAVKTFDTRVFTQIFIQWVVVFFWVVKLELVKDYLEPKIFPNRRTILITFNLTGQNYAMTHY